MNQAAIATKIQRSTECARGVPESASGRSGLSTKGAATVATLRPRAMSPMRQLYTVRCGQESVNHSRAIRGTPLRVSLSTVIAQTIASARSGDRPGPS